jgi:radical SAM enzyme (TIGR01210 family)
VTSVYPAQERSAWILAQRPGRMAALDASKPRDFFLEEERMGSGRPGLSGVILLTNKECAWRCLMCDLWKNTTTYTIPVGAIPGQIDFALQSWRESVSAIQQIKLYNSGSFFDSAAIPLADYRPIAERIGFAENVIVECHPKLVGRRVLRFRDMLNGSLEIAVGLETAHPDVLERLNKRFNLTDFAHATDFLRKEQIAVRAFVLVSPPFLDETEGLEWTVKSADFAFSCGASVVSLIPTRSGNGAMDRLLSSGEFSPPTLSSLERALQAVLALRKGRVFADIWDLAAFSSCAHCLDERRERLRAMNLLQRDLPPVDCQNCGRG